jgi:hypothetical protein
MVVALCNVQIASRVELQFVRHVQRRLDRRTAIAAIRPLTVAGDCRQPPGLQIEAPHPLVVKIAKLERAVRTDDQPVRIVYLSLSKARRTSAYHSGDYRPPSRCRQRRDEHRTRAHADAAHQSQTGALPPVVDGTRTALHRNRNYAFLRVDGHIKSVGLPHDP